MRGLSVAVVGVLWLSTVAGAEDPVSFADATLKAAVEKALGIADPTPTDMLGLTNLICPNSEITSLAGLEYAKNLQSLSITDSLITSLAPLAGLTKLQSLNLNDNEITSISSLSGLVNLRNLSLEDNLVSSLAPLLGLRSLRFLDVRDLPLGESAYQVQIPQIIANNPGIQVLHDRAQIHLRLSAGRGGSIISPGEGDFTYNGRTDVTVMAQADPGFVFAGFSGTGSSGQNPFFFPLQYDSDIRANFVSVLDVIHVDDDAPADPGPGEAAVSDPQEDGTSEHPFDSVREALEVAGQGATVLVQAGTYRETIDFTGKQAELTGFDPNDPNQVFWPVLDGGGNGPVVNFTRSNNESCRLTGFVITGGQGRTGTAIRCTGGSPVISHCLIAGNRATDGKGAAILCTDSQAAFVNCTIVDNYGGPAGAGLSMVNGQVTAANCIFWGNRPRDVVAEGNLLPAIRYSIVTGNWAGPGNLATDPLFAGSGGWVDGDNPAVIVAATDPRAIWSMGDYHVRSRAGRWEPGAGAWVQDEMTSPGVDAGDPAAAVGSEPWPNGGIINLGAYGGTIEASKSDRTGLGP